MSNLEIFGYFASIIVAMSLMMKNIVKLRLWNFAGAAMFSAYGLFIGAWPVFVLNGWIAVVDIWYLLQMRIEKDYFDLLDNIQPESKILGKFVDVFKEDIQAHFPNFSKETLSKGNIIVILRNLSPVGLVIYEFTIDSKLLIHIDYVAPEYRDLQTARYLLENKKEELKNRNITHIIAYTDLPAHQKYLKKIGFQSCDEKYLGQTLYEKRLAS